MSVLGGFILPHPPLIIPEVGKGEEKGIQTTIDAYESAANKIAKLKPETIVVISPHSVMYGDYFHISPGHGAKGDFGQFGAPGVSLSVKYDTGFVKGLSERARQAGIPAGTLGEKEKSLDHGVLIPLHFVEHYWKDYEVVRVSISGLSFLTHYHFGRCVAQTARELDRRVVLIASGDLSHKLQADGPYGFSSEGPQFDRKAVEIMESGDFGGFLALNEEFCESAAECGLRSFIEMAGALDAKQIKPEFLSYEGPFGVGYAVCGFEVTGEDETRRFGEKYEKEQQERLASIRDAEDEFVRLARLSLETYIKTGDYLKSPGGLSGDLAQKKAGVFVSLKKEGRLRGCIGTIAPTAPCIAGEIIENAVSAGTRDPRFGPVTEGELPFLVYSVDVLDTPEPISSLEELDVRSYGVIVSKGGRRGLLLPCLSGVDTPEAQVSIALQKAGIASWEKYSMERFEVVRHT